MRPVDLSGKRFGRLTAVRPVRVEGERRWICRCDCGNERTWMAGQLNYGKINSCGCVSRGKGIHAGDKFGKLTAESPAGCRPGRGRDRWLCRCDCGGSATALARCLQLRRRTDCGCGDRERWAEIGQRRKKPEAIGIWNRLITGYRSNARTKKLECDLSNDEFKSLMSGNCHYCGCSPSRLGTRRGHPDTVMYNGIDRMDSDLGYVHGNVVSCCTRCNFTKKRKRYEEFLRIVTNGLPTPRRQRKHKERTLNT